MKQIFPTIRIMTPEETRTVALINAGSVIDYDGISIPISSGRSDHVYVFVESTAIYVLSINYRHEYIGYEVFDATSGEEYENIFLQYEWELDEYLGSRWKDLLPSTIVCKLRLLLF